MAQVPAKYPIASLPDGRVRWSDGSVTAPMSTSQGYVSTKPIAGTVMDRGYQKPVSGLNTLGATTTGGGGGGGQNLGQNNNASDQGNEQQLGVLKFLADLENAKRQAQNIRESGQASYDIFNKGLGDFRNQVNTQYSNADQQIGNTFNEIAGGNARLAQDARTKALLNARVGNYGDSSRLGALNQVTGNLAGMQGSALARRGENEANNLGLKQQREGQANQAGLQASQQLADINREAGQVENMGIQNAGFDLGSYINNLLQKQSALAAIQPPSAQGLAQFNPNFAGLQNTLGTLTNGLVNSVAGGQGYGGASNLANNPNDIMSLIRSMYLKRPQLQA